MVVIYLFEDTESKDFTRFQGREIGARPPEGLLKE